MKQTIIHGFENFVSSVVMETAADVEQLEGVVKDMVLVDSSEIGNYSCSKKRTKNGDEFMVIFKYSSDILRLATDKARKAFLVFLRNYNFPDMDKQELWQVCINQCR